MPTGQDARVRTAWVTEPGRRIPAMSVPGTTVPWAGHNVPRSREDCLLAATAWTRPLTPGGARGAPIPDDEGHLRLGRRALRPLKRRRESCRESVALIWCGGACHDYD
jgi:hypothetical protein